MTSPIVATVPDRAGLATTTASPEPDLRSPQFGTLLDSQLAAASVPFAPHPPTGIQPTSTNASASEPNQRIDRSHPRQGSRRQRR